MRWRCEASPVGIAAQKAAAFTDLVPRIETERLVLRAPRPEDFAAYAEILMSPRAAYMGGPFDRPAAWADFGQATASWLLHGHGLWTIAFKISATDPLGFVLIGLEPGDCEPELGYFLRASAEGQGVAREAAKAARSYAFEELCLPSLVSYIDAGNTRSVALARGLGAVEDGTIADVDGAGHALVFRHPKPEHA